MTAWHTEITPVKLDLSNMILSISEIYQEVPVHKINTQLFSFSFLFLTQADGLKQVFVK